MAGDILDLADRLWRGEASIAEHNPVGHQGQLVELCNGVAFVPSFGNVSAFATGDGLVLVDTGSAVTAEAVHGQVRAWRGERLNTVVYSHGHIDHVGGLGVWEEESARRGWPGPEVIAHEAVPLRFDRYVLTAGYNGVINGRQLGVPGLRWPVSYRYPDRTYHGQTRLDVGGRGFSLRHEKGETDDHTVTWLADQRVLCCGDLFIWVSPNAGNPQKVQRYPLEWAAALRRMVALAPEYLLPGHGPPVVGAERVAQALADTAELLEALVGQTIEVMNGGGRLDDAIHSVTPPAHLASRPYLQPAYDEPEFVIRNAWRYYGGWWDGNPATLKPAPERALAAELATLAGGPAVLAGRALALLDQAMAGQPARPGTDGLGGGPGAGGSAPREDLAADADAALRLAGHLAELAWLAAPAEREIAEARRRVLLARAGASTSTMARGIFRSAAAQDAR